MRYRYRYCIKVYHIGTGILLEKLERHTKTTPFLIGQHPTAAKEKGIRKSEISIDEKLVLWIRNDLFRIRIQF